jgi:transposase
MIDSPQDLPGDAATLKSLVEGLFQTLTEKDRRIEQLGLQVEWLKRQLFGRRSEKLDPGQLALALDELSVPEIPAQEPETEEPLVQAPSVKGHGRQRLPSQLRRERIEYHPPEAEQVCPDCSQQMARIGEEVSEQLEYVPASIFVIEHARIKYACRGCAGHVVIGAPEVAQPIAKGLPGPGLMAHVLTCKYADHLPLHRQESILERQGVQLSRSTLCDWVREGARLLSPVVDEMSRQVLLSRKIHTDDTKVPVQDKDRKSLREGRLWVYLGDDKHPHVVFSYTPNRKRDGPQGFLKDYKGFLQADAYTGYDAIYAGELVIEVACWAHARRKFFDAMKVDPKRAQVALAYIRRLYEIEKRRRKLQEPARSELRQAEAKPIVVALGVWLQEQVGRVAPKSPMAEAIGYARGQWVALTRYLEDEVLDIDNNAAERALRRIAVGRKNWLFAGSDEGGHRAAIVYSLIATCARLKINPFDYLQDALRRLPSLPPDQIADLTPQAWLAQRTVAVSVAPAA